MQTEQIPYLRITIKLALLGLILAFLVLGRTLFVPLTIALFFSFLLLPVSVKLESWNIPRAAAIIISIVMAIVIFGGLFYFFYTQIMMFVNDWPELSKMISKKMESLHTYIRENFNISKYEQKNWLEMKKKETADSADEIAMGVFSATGTFLASFALIPIYIFFMTY